MVIDIVRPPPAKLPGLPNQKTSVTPLGHSCRVHPVLGSDLIHARRLAGGKLARQSSTTRSYAWGGSCTRRRSPRP